LQVFVCYLQILASTNSAKICAHVSAQEITPKGFLRLSLVTS
jgi:hypothetical protein